MPVNHPNHHMPPKTSRDTHNKKTTTLQRLTRWLRARLPGQFTIVALILTLLLILILARFHPILRAYIDDVIPGMNPMDATLLSTVPFFILLFIMMSAIWYIVPRTKKF